jgi:alpha,alpha-trehalase
VAAVIREKLLKPGGIVTTEFPTGEQWDAPNGWAPLEWMTIWGLDRCGQKDLAADIAGRWVKLNEKVYKETGKLNEKYNVSDINKEAGGGEYPGQDGFGWTNGVLLKLIRKYGLPAE